MRIVVTGATGQLGCYLTDHLESLGLEVEAWSRRPADGSSSGAASKSRFVDLARPTEISAALASADPDLIFHLAAISTVDGVRNDPQAAEAVNVHATELIANWCAHRERRLLFTSTDLVFDGERSFYREEDEPRPILRYGRTKLDAERFVLATERGLVTRLSLLFGFSKSGRAGFFDRAITALRSGQPQTFFSDEFRTPLDYGSAVAILIRLAFTEERGLVHVAGRERLSRWELMRRVAKSLGIEPELVLANRLDELSFAEPRPRDVSLRTAKLRRMIPETGGRTVETAIGSEKSQGCSPGNSAPRSST